MEIAHHKLLTCATTDETRLLALAVFRPILRCKRVQLPIPVKLVGAVQQLWRGTVNELHNCGWSKLRDNPNMFRCCINCRPFGAYTKLKTRFCRFDYICPFCYARAALAVYRRVLSAFPKLKGSREAEYKLLYYELNTRYRVGTYSPRELYEQATHRLRRLRTSTANMGGHERVSIEPATWPEPASHWRVREAALYITMAEPGVSTPVEYRNHLFYSDKPTRKLLLYKTASLLRYPPGLLLGDTEQVKQVLEDRAGLRLFQNLGLFRQHLVAPEARVYDPDEADADIAAYLSQPVIPDELLSSAESATS